MLVNVNKKHPGIRKKFLKPFLFNCNPNIPSILGVIMACISGYAFYINQAVAGALFFGFSGFFDILDGEIAKTYNRTSKLGDFLDHTFDRVADVLVFVGVAMNPTVPMWIGLLTITFILLVSYMGTQFQAITKKRLYGGIAGRSDRCLVLFIFGIGTLFFAESLYYGTVIILALSAITFVQRFHAGIKEIKN